MAMEKSREMRKPRTREPGKRVTEIREPIGVSRRQDVK